jgi:hypothetical protein
MSLRKLLGKTAPEMELLASRCNHEQNTAITLQCDVKVYHIYESTDNQHKNFIHSFVHQTKIVILQFKSEV